MPAKFQPEPIFPSNIDSKRMNSAHTDNRRIKTLNALNMYTGLMPLNATFKNAIAL